MAYKNGRVAVVGDVVVGMSMAGTVVALSPWGNELELVVLQERQYGEKCQTETMTIGGRYFEPVRLRRPDAEFLHAEDCTPCGGATAPAKPEAPAPAALPEEQPSLAIVPEAPAI